MALTEKIRVLFEVDDKGSFGKLKKDIAQAETATGKMKTGVKGLSDMLRQNAAPAAIAAGAALVAFGVKAVSAFQDTALAAGKFADATGLAVEDASRWIEVAGDIGIEAGTIESSFTKLNKAIADGKPTLEAYGIEVVKTADGITDANATFLNARDAIAAIEDPTKRAKAAQELFGRSYTEVAELLEMSANDVRVALENVSDAKVISEEELKRARDYRAAMDELNDKIQDLSITVGGRLAEEFVYAAENAELLASAVKKIPGGEGLGRLLLGPSPDERENVRDWLTGQIGLTEDYAGAIGQVIEKTDGLEAAQERVNSTSSRAASVADAQGTAIGILQNRIENYKKSVDEIDEERLTEIQAAIDAGDLARAEALLNEVTRPRVVQVGIAINQGAFAGATAGAGGRIGQGIGAGIAAAVAGIKMPSSLSGGGGGGGGGGASPAETEAEQWDAAIAKAYEYGEVTTQQYIDYLTMRLEGEDKYSDTYFQLWKQRQSLEQMLDDQAERRRKDEEAAAKEAADEAKRQADELKRQADEQARLIGNLTINVTNSGGELDPMQIKAAVEQAIRLTGRRFLGG